MKWVGCILLYLLVHLESHVVVQGRRTRHAKRRSEAATSYKHSFTVQDKAAVTPKQKECEVKLPAKCSCSRQSSSLSVTCFQADLKEIPSLNVGPNIVKTLNLEQNQLQSVKIGSFFGIKIERLLLSNNSISTLDFLAFWGLEFHLQTLDLSYNLFKQVPSSSLRLLRNLRSLSLKGNKITALRDFDFGYLRTLEVLALDNNPIAVIAPHTFDGTKLSLLILNSIDLRDDLGSFPSDNLKYLKGLSLANNGISSFPQHWFDNLKSLRSLNLDGNRLSDLPADILRGVGDTLEQLDLNDNLFTTIPREALRSLLNLNRFSIRHNLITTIYPKSFNESYNLQTIDLSNNSISKMSFRAFDGTDSMQRIDLRDNYLITFDDRTVYWSDTRGREILLGNNPFLCNCLVKWIKREFKRKTDLSKMFTDALDMRCYRPSLIRGVPIVRVQLREFNCEHAYYYYSEVEEGEADLEEGLYDEDPDSGYDDSYRYSNYDHDDAHDDGHDEETDSDTTTNDT